MKILAFFGVLLAAQLVASSSVLLSMDEIEEQLKLVQELQQLDDLTPEERLSLSSVSSWLKEKALALVEKSKEAFLANGGTDLLQKAKDLILNSVKVQALVCKSQMCETCISLSIPPFNGRSACFHFGLTGQNAIGIKFSFDGQDLMSRSLDLNALSASCVSLSLPIGDVCLQGIRKKEGEASFCLVALVKQYSIGREMCVSYVDGKFVPSMKSTGTFSGNVLNNQLFKLAGNVVESFLKK